METLYLALIIAALFFYLHITLTYLFSVKYLSLLERSENYHITPLAISFTVVCIFTYLYYFVSQDNPLFPVLFHLVMMSVIVAKFFYFQSLTKLLGAKIRVDKLYLKLAAFYVLLSFYFFVDTSYNGMATYFDLSKPELSGLPLREKLLPFEINQTMKVLFTPNYILGFVFYCYLLVVALKKREKLIAFGVAFTIASILFTNSYHLFTTKYWIPLNIVADLFEMLRLHWAQKEKLSRKVEEYNKQLADVNGQLDALNEKQGQMQIYRHDLNNDLSVSSLNIHKAKLFLRSVEAPAKDRIVECLDQALSAQQMAADFVSGNPRVTEVSLRAMIEKVCRLNEVTALALPEAGVKVKAVKHKLESCVVNLIKNAREANIEDKAFGVFCEIERKNGFVSLRITDTGSFKRIKNPQGLFEKGFSTKAKDGRGLGLYSVRSFMQSMGGDVELLENKGKVCFSLNFPENLVTFDLEQ